MMVAGISEFAVFFLFLMSGQAGLPLGMPPGPEDPAMSQFAPADCLFYTSWSSTVAPDPDGSVTERWMASPEIQGSFNKLKSAIKQLATSGDAQSKAVGEIAYQLAERCLTNSCGFYISELKMVGFTFEMHAGALIALGDDANEINEKLSSLIADMNGGEGITNPEIGGTRFRQFIVDADTVQNVITWGTVDDKYLAVTIGKGEMQRLLENLKTDAPEWLGDLRGEIPVDRTSAITWVNMDAAMDVIEESFGVDAADFERVMDVTGLSNLQSAGWISGLDDASFLCRGSIHVDGEPTGLLGLFGGEALEPETFGKISNDRMLMTGMRISIPNVFALIRDLNDLNDWSRGQFDQGVEALNGMIGIDIEDDVIDVLDDHAYVYGSINFANPTAGWVLSVGASRQMELNDTYNTINEFIKTSTEASDQVEFEESEVNGTTIYGVKDTSEWNMMPNFSWTLADGELLISMDKSSLRRHIRREAMAEDALVSDPWFADNAFTPLRMDAEGPYAVVSLDLSSLLKMGVPLLSTFGNEMFPDEFDFSFDDLPSLDALTRDMKPSVTGLFRTPEGFETLQRQTYPGGTPGTMLGTAVIGVMPATMQVRAASARTDSANRMRQLMLSMHNYHDANRRLPARFSKNDEDEPLLSWRVYILPYLEENDLYEEFHLDEPWDSEHNKALVERMPRCYAHPVAQPEAGKTVYVVPDGEGSIMTAPRDSGRPTGMTLEQVSDGTSRTGVIFETNEENAVIWTKPDDFDWSNIEDPVDALFGGWAADGVNVALADGSVQFISRDKLREILDKLITTDDGEIIDWSEDADAPEGRAEIDFEKD